MHTLQRALTRTSLIAAIALLGAAHAELSQVSVGGEIRIRGEYWSNSFYPAPTAASIRPVERIPGSVLQRRPTGDLRLGDSIVSFFSFGEDDSEVSFFQQRTTLNFTADFTDDVTAFIEFESWGVWGDDSFRSDYFTGADRPASPTGSDKVDLYQAYIEAREMFGTPLRLRIGRQEMVLGSGWLVGNNTNFSEFRGLFFDAIRLTYDHDAFSVDAFWSKLDENSFTRGPGEDGDLFGVYASYAGLEDIVIDAYWLWVRDSVNIEDVRGGPFVEWREDLLGLDDYDTTNLHTVGLRAAGVLDRFDFELEAAYQFGDADRVGARFRSYGYGDNNAEFGEFAAHAEAGYTFATRMAPRLGLHAAYFGGEDNRDLTFLEWLNPWRRPTASISFNRLFSNKVYSYFLDENSYLSNVWLVGGSVEFLPTESVKLAFQATYFEALEEFDLPVHFRLAGTRIFYGGPYSFLTTPADTSLGVDVGLTAEYAYSEDLVMRAGWSHFFVGDGIEDGNFVDLNGLFFMGAEDRTDDSDYFFVETELHF